MKHIYSLTRRIGLLLVCSTYLLGSATPLPADSWWSKAWNGVTSWWSSLSGTQKAVAGTAAVACVGLACFYGRSGKKEPAIIENSTEINQIFRAIQSQRDEGLAASGNQDNTLSSLLKTWVNHPTKQPDELFKILVHKAQRAAATNNNIKLLLDHWEKVAPLNNFYAIIFRYNAKNAQFPPHYEVLFLDTDTTKNRSKIAGNDPINLIEYPNKEILGVTFYKSEEDMPRTYISANTMQDKLNELTTAESNNQIIE